MSLRSPYSLHGPRVLLRPWLAADRPAFAEMNADARTMRFFPRTLSVDESDALAGRIEAAIAERGWGLWALQTPALRFAGFVGLSPLPADWLAAGIAGFRQGDVEIGWRLCRAAWGQGYASEAATLARDFAHQVLRLPRIVSFTSVLNLPSVAVMQRIGLAAVGHFGHPRIAADQALHRHVLYATPAT